MRTCGAVMGLGIWIASASCGGGDDDDGGSGMGTLTLQGAMASAAGKATITCVLADVRMLIRDMWVSVDDVVAGQPDHLNWVHIYSESAAVPWADRDIHLDLPIGTYRSYKFIFGNTIIWRCDHGGAVTDLTDFMDSSLPPGDELFGYNTPHGSYRIGGDGNFYVGSENEDVSPFDIRDGRVTHVTWRWNVVGLDWIDADDSGTWTAGDSLDNWSAAPGTGDSMFEFLIEYE